MHRGGKVLNLEQALRVNLFLEGATLSNLKQEHFTRTPVITNLSAVHNSSPYATRLRVESNDMCESH